MLGDLAADRAEEHAGEAAVASSADDEERGSATSLDEHRGRRALEHHLADRFDERRGIDLLDSPQGTSWKVK